MPSFYLCVRVATEVTVPDLLEATDLSAALSLAQLNADELWLSGKLKGYNRFDWRVEILDENLALLVSLAVHASYADVS